MCGRCARRWRMEHGAEVTCPVTIGYHLRTVAEAAHEALERGAALADITPFWRVLNGRDADDEDDWPSARNSSPSSGSAKGLQD